MAYEHYSDGTEAVATRYVPGPNGMVIAEWENAGTLELEVPNSCLNEDGWIGVAAKVIIKRPAASSLATRAEEDSAPPADEAKGEGGEDEGEECEGVEGDEAKESGELETKRKRVAQKTSAAATTAPAIRLQRKPGHSGAMCLFLVTSGADKAQIVSVSKAMAATLGLTPTSIVDDILKKMVPIAQNLPNMLVRRLPTEIVDDFRAVARRHRDDLLVT